MSFLSRGVMSRIKVGVVGVGYLGRYHAEKYASMEEAELVGVADIDKERLHDVAERCGTTPYLDYKDLIGRVQAVSIVVPTMLHYKIARDFMEQGVDVMLEKPMTSTLTEAGKLIRLSQEKRAILQVGHLERFNPAIVALKDHIENPLFIESHRLSTFKGRGIDVDVVLDLMIHDIDIILNIVRSGLKRVHAAGVPVITPSTDIANVHLQFENGCTANVTVSRISGKDMRKIRIFQPNAYLSVDYAKREITVVKKTGRDGMLGLPEIASSVSSFPDGDALAEELRSFLTSVRTRQEPVVSGDDGRRALRLALQITRQIKQNIKGLGTILKSVETNGPRVD